MTTKYLRDVEMIVDGGALVVRDLKVAFNVTKSLSSENNDASFEIWNLSKSSRYKFKEEFKTIEFYAGYTPPTGGSNVGLLFSGFLRDVEHRREGPDIITSVQAGDGDLGTQNGTVCKTHPTGTKPKDVIQDVVDNMPGVEVGELVGVDDLPASIRPIVTMGVGPRVLDEISRTHSLSWTIENGRLNMVPDDKTLNGVIIVSQQTGMINVPSVTDKGVNVEFLMEPDATPGKEIDVRSETLEMNDAGGLFRIQTATFSGDNRDGDFKVAVEATKIG